MVFHIHRESISGFSDIAKFLASAMCERAWACAVCNNSVLLTYTLL